MLKTTKLEIWIVVLKIMKFSSSVLFLILLLLSLKLYQLWVLKAQ